MFLFLGIILVLGIIPLHAVPGLDKCVNQKLLTVFKELQSTPGRKDIYKLCLPILQAFDCLDSFALNRTGLTVSQIAEVIPDETVQNGAKIFLNTRDAITDLCTEGMPLNTVYRENIDCLSTLRTPLSDCQEKAEETYSAYRDFIENSVQGGNPPSMREKTCMTQSYKIACAAAYIKDHCGDASRDLFLNFIKRTTVLKYGACSPTDIEELKTTFLSFIDSIGEHRPVFAQAFDFRRKKRSA